MMGGLPGTELRSQLDTLSRVGVVGNLTDGQLLQRLVTAGDEAAQGVFTALVERHGPMVLGVCRQVLGDPHDAQDAFQATFLVLARRAGAIRKADSAASWLYGVALRVAVRARADAARRRACERRGAEMKTAETRPESGREEDPRESWPELHEEIARLPAHYREPIVLCYLEGLSTEVAAERLGCPRGTVLSRLSRAREQLRGRLTRRGLSAPPALIAAAMTPEAATTAAATTAALPPALLEATVRASLQFAGRRAAETGLASAAATTLARGALYAMTISKLKTLGAAALACTLAAGGVQALAQLGGSSGTEPAAAKAAPAGDERREMIEKLDLLQTQLNASTTQNKALQQQLEQLRAELEALREAAPQATPRNPPGMFKAKRPAPARPGAATARASGPPHITQAGSSIVVASPEGDRVKVYDTTTKTTRSLLDPADPAGPVAQEPAGRPGPPTIFTFANSILVASPGGTRAVVYDTRTRSVRPLPPLTTGEFPVEVLPIAGQSTAALMLRGPKITRLAAAASDGSWHTQDLREPVEGQAMPIVGKHVAVFGLGRYVYAFSSPAKRWDVAELPEGVPATPIVGADNVTLQGGGHILTFNVGTGRWADLDLNAVLNSPDEPEKDAPKPEK